MRRFLTSTLIAMATVAMASEFAWAKEPGGGRSGGGRQGDSSMGSMGQSFNKSLNQGGNKSWTQDSNKSWNQNLNKGIQDGSKSWKPEMSNSWNQDMKSKQVFDSHKHPDFHGGLGIHDDWRYRWNNGRWWFWAPDNRWAWYDGGNWAYYDTYAVQRPVLENNFSGGPIKIVNPASNQVTLSYLLDGVAYTVPPGYSQQLREDRPWVIQFSRGPNMDEAQYGLRSGLYTFSRTNRGWELYRTDLGQPTSPVNPPPQAPANPPAPVQ